jgi:hypothetical protein
VFTLRSGITYATNRFDGLCRYSTFVGETANKGTPSNWEIQTNRTGYDGRTIPQWGNNQYPIRGTRSLSLPHVTLGDTISIVLHLVLSYVLGYEFYDGPNTVENCDFYDFVPNPYRDAAGVSMLRMDQFSIANSNEARKVHVSLLSLSFFYLFLSCLSSVLLLCV